jgi:hypothetical protein
MIEIEMTHPKHTERQFMQYLRGAGWVNHSPDRDGDILTEQAMYFSPNVERRDFFDPYGNICTRLVAPAGLLEVRSEFVVEDSGLPDEVCPSARQWDVGALPDAALPFLLTSRYCDTEKLSNLAWSLFGGIQGGWQRAQAICDYAHERIEFGYHHARATALPPKDISRKPYVGQDQLRRIFADLRSIVIYSELNKFWTIEMKSYKK